MLRILPRRLPAQRALLIALAVAASMLSCELSSGFLSESERSSLYTLSLKAAATSASGHDESPLADGTVILPGTDISALVGKKSGSLDLASLEFSLVSEGGKTAAGLRLLSPIASPAAGGASKALSTANTKNVSSIDGRLTGFQVPAGSPPGLYILTASLAGADGVVLLKSSMYLFVGQGRPVIKSVSTFPPSVASGESVLLGVAVGWEDLAAPPAGASAAASTKGATTAAAGTPDPWIRWSKDGKTFAEGLLSGGFDKVVWSAPLSEGAYLIRVEVFPSASTTGAAYSFTSPANQDINVKVIGSAGAGGNVFTEPLAFYSLLKFDGSFDDVGTRPRKVQPESFGSPALDTYSSGFGYRFDQSSGVRIPGLMPPSGADRLAAFSVVLRLDSDRSEGRLVAFSSDDGSYGLNLGIKDSRPYVESVIGDKVERSSAQTQLPRFPLTLVAVLWPVGDKLEISWSADGERIDSPPLPLPASPPEGSARLGGAQSLAGVYSGFGLIVGSSPPSYRLAMRHKWKLSLILAEAFEDAILPPLSTPVGGVSVTHGALQLEPGASLALGPAFPINSVTYIEADVAGDRSSCLVTLSSADRAPILSVRGTGEVIDPSGKVAGSLGDQGGRVAFTLEAREGSLFVRGSDAANPIVLPGAAKRFVLSLQRSGGSDRAVFERVLARASSPWK